jgi:hypothetical protein
MPRPLKTAPLDTRAARARLPVREKPHFQPVDRGLHLGYVKSKTGGSWIARRYAGNERYHFTKLGRADDTQAADGAAILSYHQALAAARTLTAAEAEQARLDEIGPPISVKDAVAEYVALRSARAHDRGDCASQLKRHVLGHAIANADLRTITDATLAAWRTGLAAKGLSAGSEKRVASDLRAALNAAAGLHRKQLPPDIDATIRHGLRMQDRRPSSGREPQGLATSDIRRLIQAAHEIDAAGGWSAIWSD